jgi:hypothetical protein
VIRHQACLWLLCSLLLAGGCQGLPWESAATAPEYAQRILVTFAQPPDAARAVLGSRSHYHFRDPWRAPLHLRARISQFAGAHALVELDGWPIASLDMYCVLFAVPRESDLSRMLSELQADPGVLIVQPLNRFYGMSARRGLLYDDPYLDMQYGERVAALYSLHQFTRGEGIRVGVIDSAVDERHPDLLDQLVQQRNFVAADEPGDRLHGTAVAGVIAALGNNGEGGVGLAPQARLFSYGACGNEEGRTVCNSFDLAKAVEEAIHDQVQVLNLSLAGPADPLLAALLSQALDRGMIVVASRNDGDPGANFPASHPGVIAAGASTTGDKWFLREEQLSTRAGGGYQYFYGSSVASAGAAGLAALIRSRMDAGHASRLLASLADDDCGELAVAADSGFQRAIAIAAGCLPDDLEAPAASVRSPATGNNRNEVSHHGRSP